MDAAARLKRKRTREKMSRVVAQNFDDISEGDLSELAEMMKQKWPKSLTSDYSADSAPPIRPAADNKASSEFGSGPPGPGPLSYEDFFDWPACMIQRLQSLEVGEEVAAVFKGHCQRGVVMATHYSGIGTAEDAAHFAMEAGVSQFGLGKLRPKLECHSSCDANPVCRQVLLGSSLCKHVLETLWTASQFKLLKLFRSS